MTRPPMTRRPASAVPRPTVRPARRALAGLAVVGALALAVRPAGAQSLDDVERYASRALASCNYSQYIERAKQVSQGFQAMKDWKARVDAFRANGADDKGLWTWDLLQGLVKEFTKRSAEKQSTETSKGIVKQLENACQMWVTMKNVDRQLQVARLANLGIEGAVRDVFKGLDVKAFDDPQKVSAAVDSAIQASFRGHVGDRVFEMRMRRVADSASTAGLRGADDADRQLKDLARRVDSLGKELKVYASRSSPGAPLACPDSFPPLPSPVPADRMDPVRGPICGPAAPGRTRQITALILHYNLGQEIIRSRLAAQQLSVDALDLGVDRLERLKAERARDGARRNWTLGY